MRTITFYRWSLSLPILLPLCSCLTLINPESGKSELPPLTWVAIFVVASGAIGGIPYLFTLWRAVYIQRSDDEAAINKLIWVLPIRMIPMQAAFNGVIALGSCFTPNANVLTCLEGGLASLCLLVPFVLVFGYTYVVLMHLLLFLFRSLGWVEEDLSYCGEQGMQL